MPSSSASLSTLGKRWRWILLGLSLVYLLIEFVFNATLLNTASSLSLDDDALHRVELFGRSVSGAGFALLVLGILAKAEFRLEAWPQRAGAIAFAAVCLTPFLLDFAMPYPALAAVAAGGAALAMFATFRSKKPPSIPLAVFGTVVMAWMAMFAGQKILIERFLIEPTGWETRLTAQYMQMMKAGLARNLIKIEDAPLDPERLDAPEERTFIALVGALVMRTPEFIELVKGQEDRLVRQISASMKQDELPERYADYRREGESFQQVWARYKEGTHSYNQARQTAGTKAKEEYAALLNRLDKGYRDYLSGVERFRDKMRPKAKKLAPELKRFYKGRRNCKRNRSCIERWDSRYAKRSKRFLGKDVPWTFWCNEREANVAETVTDGLNSVISAPFEALGEVLGAKVRGFDTPDRYSCPTDESHLQTRLMVLHEDEFKRSSGGYGLGIDSQEAFIANPVTVKRVRRDMKRKGIELPDAWQVTDSATFTRAVAKHIRGEASKRWRSEVTAAAGGYMPPNLSYSRVVQHPVVQQRLKSAMGDAYIKGMTFEYSEREFKKRVVDPETTRAIKRYLHKLRHEAQEFANGGAREYEGKQYLRGVLIPPISLFLSLFFALLTTGKSGVALLNIAAVRPLEKLPVLARKGVNAGLWVLVLGAVVVTPYFIPNKFSDSRAFEYFAERASESSQVLTLMTEWTIRMQPVMYPIGRLLRDPISGVDIDLSWLDFSTPLNAEERRRLEAVLTAGEASLKADRLMTPKSDSAYTHFNRALAIDPGNTRAEKGMEAIIERYEALTRQAIDSGKGDLAETYYGRVRKVRERLSEL